MKKRKNTREIDRICTKIKEKSTKLWIKKKQSPRLIKQRKKQDLLS